MTHDDPKRSGKAQLSQEPIKKEKGPRNEEKEKSEGLMSDEEEHAGKSYSKRDDLRERTSVRDDDDMEDIPYSKSEAPNLQYPDPNPVNEDHPERKGEIQTYEDQNDDIY